jgi:hypothetical protein
MSFSAWLVMTVRETDRALDGIVVDCRQRENLKFKPEEN